MKTTCHSEYGRIASVVLKRPVDAFVDDDTLSKQWKSLNFLEKPDLKKAVVQYEAFEKILTSKGPEVIYLPSDPNLSIDSIYTRDASIVTDFGVVLCSMGKPTRGGEPAAEGEEYKKNDIKILGTTQSPGTLEGGDCAWIDPITLAVGRTRRTNDEGIRQLKELLEPKGVKVLVVPMPDYQDAADVFHLMSVFSPIDSNLAVIYSPLMPLGFRNEFLNRGYMLIDVPENEFQSMGCNVLAIAPRTCMMVAGNPETKKWIEAAGGQVMEYNGSEISVKGGGGPTCLTRPIERFV
jgi:N-dimethylarginine dimethylaminohydrolase